MRDRVPKCVALFTTILVCFWSSSIFGAKIAWYSWLFFFLFSSSSFTMRDVAYSVEITKYYHHITGCKLFLVEFIIPILSQGIGQHKTINWCIWNKKKKPFHVFLQVGGSSDFVISFRLASHSWVFPRTQHQTVHRNITICGCWYLRGVTTTCSRGTNLTRFFMLLGEMSCCAPLALLIPKFRCSSTKYSATLSKLRECDTFSLHPWLSQMRIDFPEERGGMGDCNVLCNGVFVAGETISRRDWHLPVCSCCDRLANGVSRAELKLHSWWFCLDSCCLFFSPVLLTIGVTGGVQSTAPSSRWFSKSFFQCSFPKSSDLLLWEDASSNPTVTTGCSSHSREFTVRGDSMSMMVQGRVRKPLGVIWS